MALTDVKVKTAKPKEKMLSIGVYPDVSLADAREKRSEARKILAAGNVRTMMLTIPGLTTRYVFKP